MRKSRASLTAEVIAFTRGVASARPGMEGLDPLARELLGPVQAPLLAAVQRLARSRLGLAVDLASLGFVDHVALRTRMIDEAVDEAVRLGARQLVILGAGLDARAFRLASLSELAVFEVDHPNTQADKRARLRGRPPLARELRFVPVDFERVRLGPALDAAGHDPALRSMWIWEGVTPYLRPSAIDATLRVVTERSAPKSRLVLTYGTPETVAARPVRLPARLVLDAIGEPLLGLLEPHELERHVRDAGLVPVWDHHPTDVAARFGRSPRRPPFSPSERLALVERP